MDLADTMVSSKTQQSRVSDGAAAISSLPLPAREERRLQSKTNTSSNTLHGNHIMLYGFDNQIIHVNMFLSCHVFLYIYLSTHQEKAPAP